MTKPIVYVTTSTCAVCGKDLPATQQAVVGRGVVVPCCEDETDECRRQARRIWSALTTDEQAQS